MSRPSVNAIRRAGVAGALGAGLALLGISLTGMASLDSDLRVASQHLQQQQRPAARDHRVSFEQRRPEACRRPDAAQQDQPRWKPVPAPASLPTT
jgi:hypothetical protein